MYEKSKQTSPTSSSFILIMQKLTIQLSKVLSTYRITYDNSYKTVVSAEQLFLHQNQLSSIYKALLSYNQEQESNN